MAQREARARCGTGPRFVTDLVCDGNSLFARAWFANQRDGHNDPSDVVRSVLQTAFSLLNPGLDRIGARFDRTLFCWDGEHERDKGQRQPKPQAYADTRLAVMDALKLVLGAENAVAARHEADDAVATVVYRNWQKVDAIYVVSGDKDLMQLHGKNVYFYSLSEQALLSEVFICNKFKVKRPSHVAIALAIIGDRVDNIKGVPGWGPKKVEKLFNQVSLKMGFEEVLEVIDAQMPDSLTNDFFESLERTLLDTEVPGIPDPAPLKLAHPRELDGADMPGLKESYQRMYAYYHHSRTGDEDEEDY